jgi:DNA ligase-1
MKQEFLMLAHVYMDQPVNGWFVSEKLDGVRALWDGGLTRGKPCSQVPFANTGKDHIRVSPPVATGLWTRYGKAIQAPDWFLDCLPPYPLDGELYAGRQNFQTTSSIVRTLDHTRVDWDRIQYVVFDSPPYHAFLANREIDCKPHWTGKLVDCFQKLGRPDHPCKAGWDYMSVYRWLRDQSRHWSYPKSKGPKVELHRQVPLLGTEHLPNLMSGTLDVGGEGLMLRNPTSYWVTQRAKTLLKVKGERDDEATVVGYVWGRETDRGSKLLGLMGALVVEWMGRRFELSGFTEEERRMSGPPKDQEGYVNPGLPVSGAWTNKNFPVGSRVTFRYRETTDKGLPKEARYWRKRED